LTTARYGWGDPGQPTARLAPEQLALQGANLREMTEGGGEVLDQAEPLVFLLLAAGNVPGHCRGPDD